MKYCATALNAENELSIEAEGLRIGSRFIDFADFGAIVPMNHRVLIDLLSGERVEVSMLGFSFDGFWEELSRSFAARSLESLFVEESAIMSVEGEYETPEEKGRGLIELYPDSISILPPSSGAVRSPLCFTAEINLDGYLIRILTDDGERFTVGRMGYDTKSFAERALKAMGSTKKERAKTIAVLKAEPPFSHVGLFRTTTPEIYWQAAYGNERCALELFTGDDSATYLYRFNEPKERFMLTLEKALEAMGPHREIIYISDEQLAEKPLYRMAVARCRAVRELRARFSGRLIHSANHAQKLSEFLND